jgi:hypothetical protein
MDWLYVTIEKLVKMCRLAERHRMRLVSPRLMLRVQAAVSHAVLHGAFIDLLAQNSKILRLSRLNVGHTNFS